MHKSLNNNRPHRPWRLQEPLMMRSLHKNKYIPMCVTTLFTTSYEQTK